MAQHQFPMTIPKPNEEIVKEILRIDDPDILLDILLAHYSNSLSLEEAQLISLRVAIRMLPFCFDDIEQDEVLELEKDILLINIYLLILFYVQKEPSGYRHYVSDILVGNIKSLDAMLSHISNGAKGSLSNVLSSAINIKYDVIAKISLYLRNDIIILASLPPNELKKMPLFLEVDDIYYSGLKITQGDGFNSFGASLDELKEKAPSKHWDLWFEWYANLEKGGNAQLKPFGLKVIKKLANLEHSSLNKNAQDLMTEIAQMIKNPEQITAPQSDNTNNNMSDSRPLELKNDEIADKTQKEEIDLTSLEQKFEEKMQAKLKEMEEAFQQRLLDMQNEQANKSRQEANNALDRLEKSMDSSLEEIRKTANNSIKEALSDQFDPAKEKLDATISIADKGFEEKLIRMRAQHEEAFENLKTETEEGFENFKLSQDVEKTLIEAKNLWQEKAEKHAKAYFAFIASPLVVFFILAFSIFCFYGQISNAITEDIKNDVKIITAIIDTNAFVAGLIIVKRLLLFTLPILFVVWLIRVSLKLATLNLSLKEDAEQRHVLSDTYIMMQAKGQMKPEERAIMLNTLFMPLPGVQNLEPNLPNSTTLSQAVLGSNNNS